MKCLANDYFNVVAATGGDPSYPGVSIQAKVIESFEINLFMQSIESSGNTFLHLTSADIPTIDYLSGVNFTSDKAWSLETDSKGHSRVSTLRTTVVTGTDFKTRTKVYLARRRGDGHDVTAVALPSKSDVDAFSETLKRTSWVVNIIEVPELDCNKRPLKMLCSFENGFSRRSLSCEPKTSKPGSLAMRNLGSPVFQHWQAGIWQLEMQPMGPSPFKYQKPPWKITTTDNVG